MTLALGPLHLQPLLPDAALAVLAAAAAAATLPALILRARGALLRAALALVLLALIARPGLVHEQARYLPDILLLVTDRSASMSLGDRTGLAERTRRAIESEARAIPDLALRTTAVPRSDNGTQMFAAIGQALADIPAGRLAGIVAITDGQVHDRPDAPLAAPLHVLVPAAPGETDRRLRIVEAPPYGIVGQTVRIGAVVEDLGAHHDGDPVTVTIRRDGEPPGEIAAQIGTRVDIDVPVRDVGQSLLELQAAPLAGAVSTINSHAVVRINGVRDRLRVLLVSGEPNQGERAWRRLLKADPAVDLVHFTILRLPDRDDFTPLNELALIAFPTRELFQEKINDFDLIILDRFEDRGLLPARYLQNIADFVRRGGGLLLTAGPEFAGTYSLENTPLGDVLPASVPQEAGVVETPFRPTLTATGRAHPVTAGLPGAGLPGQPPAWGPWYRALAPDHADGEILMNGPDGHPLLVLDHRDQGRVAMLLSDQIWLWSRGEGGGGPQAELLRRVAHWLMKEPDLEEERLTATIGHGSLSVERRSLAPAAPVPAEITAPDGTITRTTLHADGPGTETGTIPARTPGIWRVRVGDQRAFAASDDPDPIEDSDLHATTAVLQNLAGASGGSARYLLPAGVPALRMVDGRARDATRGGADWIGLHRNRAHVVTGVTEIPLVPLPVGLACVLLLAGLAWWREGSG